ncbi:GmrSD restriction endonuclease domain-containing protein [Methanobrevibacter sp.]|uniref:GmrSD restriction endonuclease domain-containing protein n=1 Tax=Methanobrevibacter sp. TaxID=66852 RepID=UPI003D7CB9EB
MKAGNTTLNKFLKRPLKMSIPIYQRKYNWSLEECRQLFEDILSIGGDEDRKSYFIGSVVVKTESDELLDDYLELTLIDGQQRITTLTLIYCAICNYYKNIDERVCYKLYNDFLINDELEETTIKLTLTKDDDESLKYIINSIPTDKKFNLDPKKSVNIYNNYEFFRKQITDENIETVMKGLKKLVFISVVLNQNDNPQLIFESLNSTGLELNKSDLIRNYVLMGLETKDQNFLYENYWYEIEQEFKNKELFFDDFIRYYLSFESGRIPKKDDVYKEFKNHAKGFDKVEDLVKELHKYARYFGCIRFGKEEDPDLKNAFNSLYELDFNVTLPFLLSAYNDYKESLNNPEINLTREEFIKIVQYVESYCLRRAICDIPTNSMNNTFARLAKEINKKDYYNYFIAAMFGKKTYRRFPQNDEVNEKLLTQNMYSKKILKHILITIENIDGKEFVSGENSTIEHIMPQNLTKDWELELGSNYEEIHNIYLHTLGNLTLTPYNSELGDKSFHDKKTAEKGFCKSKLTLNEGLCELDKWTDKEIINRTKQLSKKIINIWKYPTKTSKVTEIINHVNETGDIKEYTLDDFEYLRNRTITRQLLDTLNIMILKLDSTVIQVINKKYISYKKNKNFVELEPLKTGLKLSLDIPFDELNDPKGLCNDVSYSGGGGTGLTRLHLQDEKEVEYVMDLIKQSYEYNFK